MTPLPLRLDTLVGFSRRRHRSVRPEPPQLPLPSGMRAPLGCDAVAVPAVYGDRILARLPRVGCVFDDGAHWWWIVPGDSDVALDWPLPAYYAAGAVVPDTCRPPGLIHRPDGSIPYTPPIPLYLALCRVTGTTPSWSRAVKA